MSKTILQFFLLFIAMLLAQVIVFNHIVLFNVAMPVIFIYFIIRLPITLSVNWVMTLSFLLGLSVDIFSDTQGMNALACTILAVLRHPILRLYFPREDDLTIPEPSIRSLGMGIYIKYMFSMVLVYCILIFLIEAFTFFNPLQLVLRIVCSTILSSLLLLGIDSLTLSRREKRL